MKLFSAPTASGRAREINDASVGVRISGAHAEDIDFSLREVDRRERERERERETKKERERELILFPRSLSRPGINSPISAPFAPRQRKREEERRRRKKKMGE